VTAALTDADSMPVGGMRLRFTTNHDETAWDNPPVVTFGRSAGARAAFVAATLLPGRPMLYNGQEVESPQKLRLFFRDPIVWGQPGESQARGFYARVLTLARRDSAFLSGAFRDIETTAEDDVIAYQRGDAVVLVNTKPRTVGFRVNGLGVAGARDLLSSHVQQGDSITLAGYGALVLARRSPNGR
jgi:glycosidase